MPNDHDYDSAPDAPEESAEDASQASQDEEAATGDAEEHAPEPETDDSGDEEDEDDFGVNQKRMSFGEHLIELRARILICIATVGIAFVLFFLAFTQPLYNLLIGPAKQAAVAVAADLAETAGQKAYERAKKLATEAGGRGLTPKAVAEAVNDKRAFEAVVLAVAELEEKARGQPLDAEELAAAVRTAVARVIMGAVDPDKFLVAKDPTSMFITSAYFAFLAAVMLTIPVTGYHAWAFVAPGLKRRERHAVLPILTVGTCLFVVGVVFAYLTVVPISLEFLMAYTVRYGGVQVLWGVRETIKFETILLLVFGLAFELPLVMVALTRVGVLTPEMVAKKRRYAILIIFIVGALLTPPDVVTQCLLAGPIIVLLEISIQISKFFRPKRTLWGRWDEEDHADHWKDEGPAPDSAPSTSREETAAEPSPETASADETTGAAGHDETTGDDGADDDETGEEHDYGYGDEYDDYEYAADDPDWYSKTEEERAAARRARRFKKKLGPRRATRGGQRRSRWHRRGGRRGRGK